MSYAKMIKSMKKYAEVSVDAADAELTEWMDDYDDPEDFMYSWDDFSEMINWTMEAFVQEFEKAAKKKRLPLEWK